MTNFDDVLARLNPATREKVRLASEVKNERQELPSIGITKALSGGIKYGNQTTIWGPRSGGKTLLALGTMGMAQQNGKICALIDAEHSFTKEWGEQFGINSDELLWSPVSSIEQVANAGVDMMKSGVDFILIDSVSSLLPASYFDEGELKPLEKTGQIGQFSKDVGKMLGQFNYINEKTAIVIISQVRTDLSGYHASLKPMGGKAMEHYNDASIKLWSSMSEKEQIMGEVHSGDITLQQPIGRNVKWFMDKARGPGMGMSGDYDMYYAGEYIGVDRVGEVLDLGVAYGKVEKRGAWYYIYGEGSQGRAKAVKYLRENPEITEKLAGEILD